MLSVLDFAFGVEYHFHIFHCRLVALLLTRHIGPPRNTRRPTSSQSVKDLLRPPLLAFIRFHGHFR